MCVCGRERAVGHVLTCPSHVTSYNNTHTLIHYGIALYKLSSKVGLKNKSIIWAVNGVYGYLFGGAEGACDGWGKRALNSSGDSLAEEELHHSDLTGRFRPTVHFSSHISLVTVQIHRFVWPFYHFFIVFIVLQWIFGHGIVVIP